VKSEYRINMDTISKYIVNPSSYKDLEGNLYYKDLSDLNTPAKIFPGIFHDINKYNFLEHGDQFRSGPYEWLSFIVARVLVEKLKVKHSICLELGSSYSPWCASWVNSFHKNSLYSLKFSTLPKQVTTCFGVEAADSYKITKEFWEFNFGNEIEIHDSTTDSKLILHGDNWNFQLLNYALVSDIHERFNHVFFPKVDLSKDNGAQISLRNIDVDYRGIEVPHVKTNLITINDLMSRIDEGQELVFSHLDLQGLEFELAKDGSLNALQKSFVIFVGVHKEDTDKIFQETFKDTHTVILKSDPKFSASGKLLEDGEQILIKTSLLNLLVPEFLLDELL
jgi:hypothetical protein